MMLARTFCRTLGELGATMSSAEFSEWIGEYVREPWGERRGDLQAAVVAKTVADMAGKVLKQDVDLTPFLIDFDKKATPQTEIPPEEFFKNLT